MSHHWCGNGCGGCFTAPPVDVVYTTCPCYDCTRVCGDCHIRRPRAYFSSGSRTCNDCLKKEVDTKVKAFADWLHMCLS